MDWIVFADDWGRHPSTTQHLVANLPDDDRILWFGSLAMRSPRLNWRDVRRVKERLSQALGPTRQANAPSPGRRRPDAVIHPVILPWHLHSGARALNQAWLSRTIKRGTTLAGHRTAPIVLIANPVAGLYAPLIKSRNLVYLRLDDWPHYEGADPDLVKRSEPDLLRRADLVVAPNPSLLDGVAVRSCVLPQGVDIDVFDAVPLVPPNGLRTLGFWGSISHWLDLALIADVARQNPDWNLELLGRVDTSTSALDGIPNIRIRPAVAHHALGEAAAHWTAAWAPFKTEQHVPRSSPLKLREYIAAGLPAASTPLDEAHDLPHLHVVHSAKDATRWLGNGVLEDTATQRAARRESMSNASWLSRSNELRQLVSTLPPRRW